MVVNLNDVLTPDVVSTSDFVNTEYLQTMVVIVPKNLEEQWLHEYAQIGDQIAEYGPKGSRGNVRGSPVVPGSSRKLMEEGDSAVYTVTLLKGQYQPGFLDKEGNFEPGTTVDYIEDFKTRAKEKRFVVREFNFDPTNHASNEEAIAELEVEVDRLWSALIRWCKAHFGETFIAWMHIKVRRAVLSLWAISAKADNSLLPDDSRLCGVRASLRPPRELRCCHVQSELRHASSSTGSARTY
jgi:V-type H+-transporting ATPase subunit C